MDNIQKIKLLNELMSKATPQNVDFTPHNGNYCVTLLATQPIHTWGWQKRNFKIKGRLEEGKTISADLIVENEMLFGVADLPYVAHEGDRTPIFKIIRASIFCAYGALQLTELHGNIIQVIQVTEYADLAEFSDPGKESQFDTAVHRFKHTVERFQRVAVFLLQFPVADSLEHRFVVFVHKDYHTLPCLLASTLDDSGKAQKVCTFGNIGAIKFFPFGKVLLQYITQTFGRIIPFDVQVQMQNGMFCPVFLQFLDGQSLEQFLFPSKVGL